MEITGNRGHLLGWSILLSGLFLTEADQWCLVHLFRDCKHSETLSLFPDNRFSPEGNLLAVGSDDNCVDFYEIKEGQPLKRAGYCKGIPNFVTQMDFSADGRFIQVGSAVRVFLEFFLEIIVSVRPSILVFVSYPPPFFFCPSESLCPNLFFILTVFTIMCPLSLLQVSTGAYERLVFTVPGGTPVTRRKDINRITWASWTR